MSLHAARNPGAQRQGVGQPVRVVPATGVRIGWFDLPGDVRNAVERLLGGSVVSARSQPGGFSPGVADRVELFDGRRAFVKAVSPELNEHTPALHRQEAVVSAALPTHAPAPRLLGVHDDGHWVALVLEDVEGRHPRTPWAMEELAAVLDILPTVAALDVLLELPLIAAALADDLLGWERVAHDPPADLDGWARRELPALRHLAARAPGVLAGVSLVHADLRADNLLLRPDGSVVLVDWPWAARGPAWFDALLLLVNVRLHGGHDVQGLLHTAAPGVDDEDLTAVLAGLAGYFIDRARRPAQPGLPTVRAFQAAQGAAVLSWVQERLTPAP